MHVNSLLTLKLKELRWPCQEFNPPLPSLGEGVLRTLRAKNCGPRYCPERTGIMSPGWTLARPQQTFGDCEPLGSVISTDPVCANTRFAVSKLDGPFCPLEKQNPPNGYTIKGGGWLKGAKTLTGGKRQGLLGCSVGVEPTTLSL